jgi:glycine C-acetyltransferase
LPSGQASVAIAALDVIEREPELVEKLRVNQEHYLSGLKALGFDTAKSVTPIVPVMTRTTDIALEMTRICRADGLLVIPVCYPAVPMDAPRLRTCVSAIHSAADIDFALDVLARAGRRTGLLA